MYCSNKWEWCNGDFERTIFQLSIEKLLLEYNVHLLIAGHTHSKDHELDHFVNFSPKGYERTFPVYDDQIQGSYDNPGGTVHLTVGTGGAQEGLDMNWKPSPSWSG